MKKIAIINLLILFILSSCDPKSCSEYIVENKLTENIEIILYQDSTITKSIYVPIESRESLASPCAMGGGVRLTLEDTDSIHIILENGAVLKYTNQQMTNNIYDTENRDIWVEEYGKETKYQGSEYRYVYTIDESTIEE